MSGKISGKRLGRQCHESVHDIGIIAFTGTIIRLMTVHGLLSLQSDLPGNHGHKSIRDQGMTHRCSKNLMHPLLKDYPDNFSHDHRAGIRG